MSKTPVVMTHNRRFLFPAFIFFTSIGTWNRLSINLTGRLRTFGGFVGNGLSPRPTLLPEKGFFLKQKSRRDTAGTGSAPRQGGKGESSGTLPRPRKQPTGLICAPLRRGRAVRVLSSFAAKTEKSRRDTAGLLFWWRMRDSNPRPLRCERSALTS